MAKMLRVQIGKNATIINNTVFMFSTGSMTFLSDGQIDTYSYLHSVYLQASYNSGAATVAGNGAVIYISFDKSTSSYTDQLYVMTDCDSGTGTSRIEIEYADYVESSVDPGVYINGQLVSRQQDDEALPIPDNIEYNVSYGIAVNPSVSTMIEINALSNSSRTAFTHLTGPKSLSLVTDKGVYYYGVYSITNTLSHCTTNNAATTIQSSSSYTATITATSGYYFQSNNVSITMGSTSITPTFASDSKSFTISISSPITGNITISATASVIPLVYYSVTNTLSHCTNSNASVSILEHAQYDATLTADTNYMFFAANITVTMGSTTITPTIAADGKTVTISIPDVTTNISITATGMHYYTVTNLLTRCTSNNSATGVVDNGSYSATITAETNYCFDPSGSDVSVRMGSTTITPTFAANNKSFTISIAEVTNSIIIAAKAIWEMPTPSQWAAAWVEVDTASKRNYNVVSSTIQQTAEQIQLKVSKGDVSSQLSIETDQIVLQSGRLIIETGNFQLDEYGTVTAVNAHLSGSFTSDVGTSGEVLTIENGVLSLGDVEFKIGAYGNGFALIDHGSSDAGIETNGGGNMWIVADGYSMPISVDYSCIFDFDLNDMGGDVTNLVQDLYWSGGTAYWDWATVHVPDISVANVSTLGVVGNANGPS